MAIRVTARPFRREQRVADSRFIAQATPIQDEAAGRTARAGFAREFPDATHLCWGLSLHTKRGERALSDDAGEPAGTAGTPILQAIRRAGVTNVIVLVARYFGGTKLGKGGLARAYRDSAGAALEGAGCREVLPIARLRLSGPLESDGGVRNLVARRSGRVVEAAYEETGRVVLLVDIPEPEIAGLQETLGRLTHGRWRAASYSASESSGG